jgi:hypothetical protein
LVVRRWRSLVLPLLALTGTACVKQPAPTYEIHLTAVMAFDYGVSEAQGTIRNLGDVPMDYQINLGGAPPRLWPGGWAKAVAVLPGQTAVWSASFAVGQYLPEVGSVFENPVNPDAVHADATITGVVPADYGGQDTEIMGTVTNTGSVVAGFAVELQGDNGEISRGYVSNLAPGQTATWDGANFRGSPNVHWVRTIKWPPAGTVYVN